MLKNYQINKEHITHKREPFFEVVRNFLEKNSIVLDIGSGKGEFAKYFDRKDFYLLDGNHDSISYLQKKYDNVYHNTLPILPFSNNFFDIIHCSHVIEHLSPEDLYSTLIEMDRCLKKDGKLIISTPLMWEGFYNDLSHIKPYNPKILTFYFINPNDNATRSSISTNYKLIELIYRYRLKDIDWFYYENPAYRFLKRVLSRFTRKYEKTGYTIVLKK